MGKSCRNVDRAIQSENLSSKDRIRAIVSRIMTRSQLSMDEGVAEDMEKFRELNINRPEIEISKRRIIIRNVPDCECYKDLIKSFTVNGGICKKESDIKFLDSGICVIEKTNDCGCKDCIVSYMGKPCDPGWD